MNREETEKEEVKVDENDYKERKEDNRRENIKK